MARTESKTVPEILAGAARTFSERQAVYSKDGPGYEKQGKILEILFPHGIKFEHNVQSARWVLFSNILTKLCRYAENISEGGHLDSIHDLGVYAFILETHDRNNGGDSLHEVEESNRPTWMGPG